MPSLYDLNSNANVRVSNSTSLYQNSGNVNIGVGGAQQIITYFDNNGNVNFALDPATGYNTIKAYFVGASGGSTYSNANVAAYLVTNTGNVQAGNLTVLGNLLVLGNTITTYQANLIYGTIIANSTAAASSVTTGALQSYGGLGVRGDIWGLTVNTNNIYYANGQPYLGATISLLQSNAATQAVTLNTLTGNVADLYANAAVQSSNIADLYANAAVQSSNIANLYANAATQQTAINTLTANAATQSSNIADLYANAASQATSLITLTANAATQAIEINTTNANLGAYQTWANATFSVSSYGNSNVAAYLSSGGVTSNIITTGNLVATTYTFANGVNILSTVTGGSGTYGNSNVAAYLPTYTGSLENSSSIINLWSNAATQQTAINTLTANAATQAGQIQVLDANLGTATTNITTLFSNAATQATSILTLTANAATQQTQIDGLTSNAATQAGQIQVLDANLGTATTNITTLFANAATQATSINTLTANAATQAGQIAVIDANLGTATTNITTLFSNAASQATDINTLYANAATQSIAIASLATGANANTAAYLPSYTGDLNNLGNVTILGNLFSDDITSLSVYVQGNAIITGNLTVQGTTTTINSNVITTNDKNITVANNVTVVSQLDGAGLDVGQDSYATWRYNYLSDSWQSNLHITPAVDNTENLGASNLRWNTVYAQTLNSATTDNINANLGAYQTYANITNDATQANIGTLFLGNISTQANLGAFQTYANATLANVNFSGDLRGNVLYDSINERIFANAAPFSDASNIAGPLGVAGNLSAVYSHLLNPVYLNTQLYPAANTSQVTTLATTSNVGMRTSGQAVPITTYSTSMYSGVTPITPNVMTINDRVIGHNHTLEIVSNTNNLWGTMGITNTGNVYAAALQSTMNYIGNGNVSHVVGNYNEIRSIPQYGRANIAHATGTFNSISAVSTGPGVLASNIQYARLFAGFISNVGNVNIQNAVGLHLPIGWANVGVGAGTQLVTRWAVLNQDTTTHIYNAGNLNNVGTTTLGTTTMGALTATGITLNGAMTSTGNVTFNTAANVFAIFNSNIRTGSNVSTEGGNVFLNSNLITLGNLTYSGNIYFRSLSPVTMANTLTIANTGDVSANIGNIIATRGNLQGTTLIDSVRGRVFANAFPESQGNIYVGGTTNILATFSNVPAYVGGALQPQVSSGAASQIFGFITSANVGLQSAYSSATNRSTAATNMYAQVTPVTANVMLNQDRFRGHNHSVELINNGTTWGTMSTTSSASTNMVATQNALDVMGYGELNHGMATAAFVQNVPWNGSSNLQYATGYYAGILQVSNAGSNNLPSNIAYARLLGGTISATANLTITNAVGLHTPASWWGVTGVTNKYAVLNEDVNTVIQTSGDLTVSRNANIGAYNSTQTNISGNTYILASNLWVSGANTQVNSTYYNFPNNGKMGSPGSIIDYYGNVNYNSGPPYYTQFFSNVIMGQTGSYNQLRGTTQVQGNIYLGAPYYEKISALGNQSGTVTINTGDCNSFTMTLTGDITLNTSNFTNMVTGKSITLTLTQDATGGRILSSNMKFAGGINTLSSAANAIDVMNVYYDGTNYLASLVKGYV